MKNTKNTKIKTYSSFALALALFVPINSFASETLENSQEVEQNISEDQNDQVEKSEKSYIDLVSNNLSNDGKKASYTFNIPKIESQSNLRAYIYLPDNSNLKNLNVVNSNAKLTFDQLTSMQKIELDLSNTDQNTITLEADIKEDSTTTYSFDLALVSEDESIKEVKKVFSELIEDSKGNKALLDKDLDGVASILSGKFVGNNQIEWTDYLTNTTDKDIKLAYPLEPSENQSFEPSSLKLQGYQLTKNGYEPAGQVSEINVEDFNGLVIPDNTLVKLTINSTVDPNKDSAWDINGVRVSKGEIQEQDQKSNEEIKELSGNLDNNAKQIKETITDIDKENETSKKDVQSDDKKALELSKKLETTNQNLSNSLDEVNRSSNENGDKSDVILNDDNSNQNAYDVPKITKELDNVTTKIKEMIKMIDYEEAMRDGVSKEDTSDIENDGVEYIKTLTEKIQESNKLVQEELSNVYGKSAVKSVMTLSHNIDDDTYKILTGLGENTAKTDEIARQINLSIETGKIIDNPEEKKQIVAIINDLESIEASNNKVLESIEDKEEISPNFDIVVDGFSQKLYKDFKKVATVTLDPLDKASVRVDANKAKKDYPTITSYLENLDLRRDLLNK
ncbi:hypothetical protein [Anaerococcus nagyae]|uniref:hypothetical protein n=1 Tax=Anaerococcus nagyae TaxID=1755241 RepID=UPI003735B1F3